MKKIIFSLVILIIVALVVYKFFIESPSIKAERNATFQVQMTQQVNDMSIGNEKEIQISEPYDSLVIVPPYLTKEELQRANIDSNISKVILKSVSLDETFTLFVIQNNTVQKNYPLDGKYGTKDNRVLKIDKPNVLKVKKIAEGDYKWFEFIK
ncbi:hypothetical protein EEL32_03700 [Brevibacillus laterosporus]|nr:hypothetical protein [Brevibacillus laterosporus]TPG90591.1 hypothetical protein EEL32_03700 [Brevibacillus laterosporus]